MSQEDIFINGELLRLRREARGWAVNDMATRACMSVKQIRQIEEGGMSSFYSTAVKVTAAKKVGALLGLTDEEVLSPTVAEGVLAEQAPADEPTVDSDSSEDHLKNNVKTESAEAVASQPPADVAVEVAAPSSVEEVKLTPVAEEEPNAKTSLWLIAALLAGAFAAAAYFQQKPEEPVAEPAPPLQVLPVEDPASAASATEGGASAPAEAASVAAAASAPAVVVIPKPVASAPMATASVSAASVARPPLATASGVARPASTPAAPAAPVASKPL